MKKWILFFSIPWILFGSVNEPMRWDLLSGYRNDTVHWHLMDEHNQLIYSEHDRDIQFWSNALVLKTIYRDIALFAYGSYGAFGQGSMKQRFANLSYTEDSPLLSWHPDVWNLNGWGYFGYAVNLTADRTYQVILIPMIGYGADYEHTDSNGLKTASGAALAPAATYLLNSSFQKSEKMCWFGPLFGGLFIIYPGSGLRFEAGYAYHRLHLRFNVEKESDVLFYDASGTFLNQVQEMEKIRVKDRANIEHSGWAKIDYLASKEWRVGLEGQIQYFTSRILDARVKNLQSEVTSSKKFKVRWTAVSALFSLSRVF
jgi:hypothetical protein